MKPSLLRTRLSQLVLLVTAVACCSVVSAGNTTEKDDFVKANILGIFYHELGHALIDIERIPIFGQEEDAADTFSIFMIDALFEEADAESLAYDAAIGFWAESEYQSEQWDELYWWGVHGPDEQRYYNTVCLFYGANPDQRQQYADDLELPEERAENCPHEYDQANASWGAVLDKLSKREPGKPLILSGDTSLFTYQIIESEIENLNALIKLNSALLISVRDCDEANAFYDSEKTEIVMCSEFETHLYQLAEQW